MLPRSSALSQRPDARCFRSNRDLFLLVKTLLLETAGARAKVATPVEVVPTVLGGDFG